MYKLKKESATHTIKKLQIKIPNFSHSNQKQTKQTSRNIKSKSNTINLKCKTQIYHPLYTSRTPNQNNKNRIIKTQYQNKSPRNKSKSPITKKIQKLNQLDLFKTAIAYSNSIEQIKRKNTFNKTTKVNNTKYFKKPHSVLDKLKDMNKTLDKITQSKTLTKPKVKYQLKMIRKLGKSQTGDIILAKSNVNGMLIAIKTFSRQQIKVDFLIDQMKIHLYCSHPNILPAYGYNIGKQEICLVMQYGYYNLYQQILRNGPFTQQKTSKYIAQILSGIQYLHRNGIMHRDIKPQNIICFGDLLKITDFGWSTKTNVQRKTLCGTLDYISPQVASKQFYDNKIDCWSIGVLMYQMLMVQPPFTQQGHRYNFRQFEIPNHLSPECQDLMKNLLQIDPKQRYSARQALDHCWIKTYQRNIMLIQKKRYKYLQQQLDKLFEQQQ